MDKTDSPEPQTPTRELDMKYRITLVIETEEGNPRKWDWQELIADTVLSVESTPVEEEEQA